MLLLSTLAAATFNCTIVLGGDVMLNGVPPSSGVWKGVESVVKSADAAFANLEIPPTSATTRTSRKTAEELLARDQFILKADPRHVPHLARAGWDVVSLGNNHAMDYGVAGLQQVIASLAKHGVGYTGAGENLATAANPAVFKTRNGTRIAVISAMAFVTDGALQKTTPAGRTTPGVHGLSLGGVIGETARLRLATWIERAARDSDLVVAAMHWGLERRPLPSSYQVQLGRALVDAGADIVWGHHPHVLQGAELYRGRPILYSAGNLVSPLPGATALFRLKYLEGELDQVELLPASISRGAVALNKGAARTAALRSFATLCDLFTKNYPHRDSRPLMSL